MPETIEKRPDDIVRLVNITDRAYTDTKGETHKEPKHFVVRVSYDGEAIEIAKSVNIPRNVAEHCLKKGLSMSEGRRWLEIVELPPEQRTRAGAAQLSENLEKAQRDNQNLQAIVDQLKAENAELKQRVKK